MDLSIRHPDYVRFEARWRMAQDFWRGGVNVLMPKHKIYQSRYALNSTSDASAEKERKISVYSWVPSWESSYLWKHETETLEEFRERCARAYNYSVFSSIINDYVSGIMRSGVIRSGAFRWFYDDVDYLGTNIDAFMRQLMAQAIVFGRVHAIADRPVSDEKPISRQDEIDRGLRAYAYPLTPLDIVDWSLDELGRFKWFVVLEGIPESRGPGEDATDDNEYYRIWYQDHWERWKGKDRKFERIGEGQTLGLQISSMYATKENASVSMGCESPLADILDGNRDVFNKLSEMDEIERMQSFGLLTITGDDTQPYGPVDVSPTRAILIPAGGSANYISPDSSHSEGKAQRLDQRLQHLRNLSGVGRGMAESSKEERSGEAILAEQQTKANQMALWSQAAQDFENKLMKIVAKLENSSSPEDVSYEKEFDFSSSTEQLNKLILLKNIGVNQGAIVKLASKAVEKIAKEVGFKDQEIRGIVEESLIEPELPEIEPYPNPKPEYPTEYPGEFNDAV